MATRIGGPMVGANIPPCTWGSMRSPMVLNGQLWGASYTRFSRAWPPTPIPLPGQTGFQFVPKAFKWKGGSLFRQKASTASEPYAGGAPKDSPYHGITVDPFSSYQTSFIIGGYYRDTEAVDNHDFLQLVGQNLTTELPADYAITSSAHITGQTLGFSAGYFAMKIGKLTQI